MAQLARRNQLPEIQICHDFGHEPIGFGMIVDDASTITTLSLVAGLVGCAMAGPIAGAIVALALINDIKYLKHVSEGDLQHRQSLKEIREWDEPEPIAAPPDEIKAVGEYLFNTLTPARKREIKAIVQQRGSKAALLQMISDYGYSDEELQNQWPGVLAQIKPQAPAPIAAAVPITQIQSPVSPSAPYDLAEDMGRNPQSSIVAGVPGAGKGMLIANALRAVKRHNPQVKIFVIDPKASGKEAGYWSIADHYFKLAFSGETVEDSAEWFMARLSEFKRFQGPKLLVIDEGATVLTTLRLAKIYEYRQTPNGKEQAIKVDLLGQFKAFLTHVSSMGDSEENWMWFISQIINCDDLGISGGQRSIFRGIGLVSPKNRKAVDNFFATGFVPLPKGGKDEVYRLMEESPCDRAYYDGKTDQWASSQSLENHSGFDRDSRTFVGAGSR